MSLPTSSANTIEVEEADGLTTIFFEPQQRDQSMLTFETSSVQGVGAITEKLGVSRSTMNPMHTPLPASLRRLARTNIAGL